MRLLTAHIAPGCELPPDIRDLGTDWINDISAYQYAVRAAIEAAKAS